MHNSPLIIIGKTGNGQRLGNCWQTKFLTSDGIQFLDDHELNDKQKYQFIEGIDSGKSSHRFLFYRTYASINNQAFDLYFLNPDHKEVFITNVPSFHHAQYLSNRLKVFDKPEYLRASIDRFKSE